MERRDQLAAFQMDRVSGRRQQSLGTAILNLPTRIERWCRRSWREHLHRMGLATL
jgi:hypothetical protein